MARSIRKLTALQVASLETPGRYADGGGLFLDITSKGSRSWIFTTTYDGEPCEVVLGGVSGVSLATARRISEDMRYAEAAGEDPRIANTPASSHDWKTIPTFGTFARDYLASVEDSWKNPNYQQKWRRDLRNHAQPLLGMPLDEISADDIVAVLKPIFVRLPRTALRLRGKIEKILDAAQARGYRSEEAYTPAAWRGKLALVLPSPSVTGKRPHPALPWREAPAFMAELRRRAALAARCLEFLILTAARSSECLGATWGEIDFELKIWSIPSSRTGSGVAHTVPLSTAAMALLGRLRPDVWQADVLLFGGDGARLSDAAMSMLLRRMKRGDTTTYGFRSTFRAWAGDATDYPPELVERALALRTSNSPVACCEDGARTESRRQLMEDWSKFLDRESH